MMAHRRGGRIVCAAAIIACVAKHGARREVLGHKIGTERATAGTEYFGKLTQRGMLGQSG